MLAMSTLMMPAPTMALSAAPQLTVGPHKPPETKLLTIHPAHSAQSQTTPQHQLHQQHQQQQQQVQQQQQQVAQQQAAAAVQQQQQQVAAQQQAQQQQQLQQQLAATVKQGEFDEIFSMLMLWLLKPPSSGDCLLIVDLLKLHVDIFATLCMIYMVRSTIIVLVGKHSHKIEKYIFTLIEDVCILGFNQSSA